MARVNLFLLLLVGAWAVLSDGVAASGEESRDMAKRAAVMMRGTNANGMALEPNEESDSGAGAGEDSGEPSSDMEGMEGEEKELEEEMEEGETGNTGGSGASGATGAVEEEEESKVVVELGSDSVAQRLKVQQSLDVGDLHFEGSSITGAQTLEFSNLQTDDLKIMGFTSFGPGSPAVRMKTLEAPLSGKASFEPYEAVVHGMTQNQIVSMTAVVVKSTEDSHVVKPNWSQYGNQPYASFWMEENRFKVQRLAPGVRMKVEEMKKEAKFLEGARLKVTFWYTAPSVQDQAKETARLAEADVVDDE